MHGYYKNCVFNIALFYLAPQVSPMPVQILSRPQLAANSSQYWVIIFCSCRY